MLCSTSQGAPDQFARVGRRGTQHQPRLLQNLVQFLFVGLGPVAPKGRGGGIENVQDVLRRQPSIARAQRLKLLLQRAEGIRAPKLLLANLGKTIEIEFEIKSGHTRPQMNIS